MTLSAHMCIGRAACRGRLLLLSAATTGPHVLDVRDAGRLDGSHLLELEGVVLETLEKALAAAENDRGDRDVDLVDEARAQVLVDDRCAAGERNVLSPRGGLGLRERRLDAVGDEVKRRSAPHHERFARMVCDDENGVV